MGQTQSQSKQAQHKVQEDDKNLRRQRALFFPLGENRRLKKIDYLLVSSDKVARNGGVDPNQISKDKEFYDKVNQLTTTSTYNLQLMDEAIREYDYNLAKDKESKVIKIELKMEKPSFDSYLDDLFSNPNTQGFLIYFTGQITESKQQLVLSNKSGDIVLYDFLSIIRRWRQVPNYQNKSLLIILDAENCGSYLGLKKNNPLNQHEDFFSNNESQNIILRKDPTFSILASQSNRKKDTDFYMGESPNNSFQGDFKNNNRIDNQNKMPQSFNDASNNNNLQSTLNQNPEMIKYIKASNFTAVFSEYLKSGPSENIQKIVSAKNMNPQNENEPYFFGHEMKAYHDFGIFFWAKYLKMMNQLQLNCYVSLGLSIQKEGQQNFNNQKIGQFCTINTNPQSNEQQQNDKNFMSAQNPAESVIVNNLLFASKINNNNVPSLSDIDQLDILDKKLLQKSEKGEYFGFVGKNLNDKKFGNPQFSKPATTIKSQSYMKSQDNLDLNYTSNHMSSLSHMDDLVHSSCQSNSAFKSTILRGAQNMDSGLVIRKYYGMQEYKLQENGNKDQQNQFQELYEGMWSDDRFHSYGTYYHSNGDKYEGEYKNGKKNGYGVYYFSNGDTYAGQFVDNIIEGYGKLMYSNGSIYIGNFKKNKRSGFGIMKQTHQNYTMIYSGEWLNNEQSGKAKIIINEIPSIEIDGSFEQNQMTGVIVYNVNPNYNANNNNNNILQDKDDDKIQFTANWRENRRITDITLDSSNSKSSAISSANQFIPLIKSFEDAYIAFVPPTVKI